MRSISDFFLTGGHNYNQSYYSNSNKTYIFREGEWRQAEDMPTARKNVLCGPVRSISGGPVQKVVAAGGISNLKLGHPDYFDINVPQFFLKF